MVNHKQNQSFIILQLALEDMTGSYRRAEEGRVRTTQSFEETIAQLEEARGRCSQAENRILALETTVTRAEAAYKDAEGKLDGLNSAIRRTLGVRKAGVGVRSRPMSSPTRGGRLL